MLWSLVVFVTNLNATNDTITCTGIYSCDFETETENTQWKFKHSTGKNKWTIGSYDNSNTCLYVSENAQDTTYGKKSASITLAYRKITLSADDSLQIEFDAIVGGEGNKDYLKIIVVPEDFDFKLPSPSASNLEFVDAYYKDNCFVFENDNGYISETKGKEHFTSVIKNNFSCLDVYLVFIWRNDNSAGTMPGAIIDNISLKGVQVIVKDSVCEGNTYTFNSKKYSQSGLYCDTLSGANGCDSIVYLDLTVNSVLYTTVDTSFCSDKSFITSEGTDYSFQGIKNDTSLTVYDTLQTIKGCDSIVTYNLTVYPVDLPSDTFDIVEICEGETYLFAQKELTQSGEYFDTLQNVFGCDSIIALTLVVNPVYHKDTTVSIEKGSSYSVGESVYTESGKYIDTLTAISGCDSIVTTDLKVVSSLENTEIQKEITIFPNPATSVFEIIMQPSANKRVILLVNSLGITVKNIEMPVNQKEIMIDVNDLPRGVYNVKIEDKDNSMTEKLILK